MALLDDLYALEQELRSGKALGLDVVFEHLRVTGDKQGSAQYPAPGKRYPLAEVDPLQPNYPGGAGQNPQALADALASAIEAAQQLPSAQQPGALLTTLERFGGFVAARNGAGEEVRGVSWFDAARLEAALAACGEQVLVLRADLSGIQDFIYGEVDSSHLKNLRARSFYLELLAVHVLRRLLQLAQVSRANVAFIGGGGFQLYLPPNARADVQEYISQFSDWLWETHSGDLNLVTAMTEVSAEEARAGLGFQQKLSGQLSRAKVQSRHGQLAQLFGQSYDPTQRIGRREALLDTLVDFGTRLAGAHSIEVLELSGDSGPNGSVVIHDRAYLPRRQQDSAPPAADRLVLNSFRDLGGFPMLSGNYVTRGRDIPESYRIASALEGLRNVADHEQLADLALGQRRLALYRCDADNMGQFFSGGIPGHSAARHATLSRLMSLFFQGYVNAICAARQPLLEGVPQAPRSQTSEHGRYLNIIYSGGDDAVVVGAWNEVLAFSVDFRRAYAHFTGQNPELGLSGGSFITKPKFPLRRMAERAADAEALAKAARLEIKENGKVVQTFLKDGFVPFLQAETPGEGRGMATRWNVFMTMAHAPAPTPQRVTTTPTLDNKVDYQAQMLQQLGLDNLKGAGASAQPKPEKKTAAAAEAEAELPAESIEATLGLLSAFLTLHDPGHTDEDGIELKTRRALLGHLQRFAEREGDVWRLPQLHYALARAGVPEGATEEWSALKKVLLDEEVWPHLPAVLSFLHLARPEAKERSGRQDIQTPYEERLKA